MQKRKVPTPPVEESIPTSTYIVSECYQLIDNTTGMFYRTTSRQNLVAFLGKHPEIHNFEVEFGKIPTYEV